MFSQKKRNHTWLYAAIALAAAIIAVFFLIGALSSRNAEEAERTNLESRVEQEEDQAGDGKVPDDSAEASAPDLQPGGTTEKDEESRFYQSYYLVKLDNNVIKIFFSDETGKLTELEETGIIYETLSADDQKRFADGIRLEKRDDLNKLMMDYES